MNRGVAVGMTVLLVTAAGAPAGGTGSFVNWESPHVSPIDLTSDGSRLLAVNTADNRIEVFTVTDDGLAAAASIPVGLDPVSVRARTNTEVWVVNHISDTISIVNLDTMNTIYTLATGDEPTDVIFAGNPQRAFVVVSQLNQVRVFDPENLSAAPIVLEIEGEDPRALATDGTNVFVTIMESGNNTTILNEEFFVSNPAFNPYAGAPNPPPNDGTEFDPPINPALTDPPPPVSIIVKEDILGAWMDDNGADWSTSVFWDLHDHDAAIIDANTLAISYVTGAMNLNMAIDVGPSGVVVVVGTDATNSTRYEPNINGTFIKSIVAAFTTASTQADIVLDINPHLDYTTSTVDQAVRDQSIGDPRAVRWSSTDDRIFVAGMGSNNVVAIDGGGARVGTLPVGDGPTGIEIDAPRQRFYVMNKFDGTISIVDENAFVELDRVAFYDPTPNVIQSGRPFLYDTHQTSGLGQASCASCHIDGRMDQLAWDLGNPAGDMRKFNQTCLGGSENCVDWHPMKGPMSTQTLFGIVGTEPLHWRADKNDLAEFAGAYESLMGDDEQPSAGEMQAFEDFVATLRFPPNPFRNMDNSLSNLLPNGGDAVTGEFLYVNQPNLGPMGQGFSCVVCHALPTGSNFEILEPLSVGGITQNFKVPQLRNIYDKAGFVADPVVPSNKGFGFIHDGSFDSMNTFLTFFFGMGQQEALDVEAFLLSVSIDTHAGVGVQETLDSSAADGSLIAEMIALADSQAVGLVVKGINEGLQRGWLYAGGDAFQSDREVEVLTTIELTGSAGPGSELTFTLVPSGSQQRIGVDRDEDGYFDRDEIDAGSDPADPDSIPGSCPADLTPPTGVDAADLATLLGAWGANPGHPADFNADGFVNAADLATLLGAWGPCG